MQWDTSLRRLVRTVAVAVLVVTMVGVQPAAADDHLLTDDILGPLGTSVDEVAALEPNPSWAGLGLFSDDALRVLEVAQNEVAAVPYAFGDDPSTPPVITPSGSQVTDFGVTMVHVPAEWVPPASGIADGVAFASTPTYAPGSDMLLMWTRFDSAVDFDQGLTFNEGVTLAIPGLPVWQSTFAGDTWEGANLIPQAVIQDGVIDFGVNRFTPPQSFGDAGVPAFYYRSGDIMAVALDLVSIEGLVEEGRTVDAAAASEGVPQTLLYTGESSDVAAHQAEDFVTELLFGFHLHTAEGAIFVPGFVLRLIAAAWAVFTFVLAPGSVLELVTTPPEPEPEPEPEAAAEEGAAEPEPAQPEPEPEEPAEEEVDPPLVDPEPADEGSGFPWVLVVVALVVVFVGCGYALLRAREKEEEEEDDEDPRDVPAPTVYGEEIDEPTCDYGIWLVQKVADDRGHRAGDGGHTLIKAPEPYARHVGDYYVTVMQILGEGTDTAEPPAPKNDKMTWSLRDRIWQMQSGVSRTIRGDGLSVATTLRVADEKKADLPENDATYTERKNYDAHTVEGTCVVHDRTVVRIEFVPAEGLTATRHRYFAKAQSSLRLEFDPFCYMHTRGADGFAEKKGLENVTEAFTFAAKELIEASCQSLHDASFDGPVRVDCANAGLSYELHKAKSVWSVAGKPGQVLEFGGPEIEAGVGPFKLGKVGLKLGDDEAHAKKVQVALEDRDDGERSGLLFEGEVESSLSSKAKLVTNAGVHQYIDNRLSMIGDVNHEMLVSAEGVVDGCDISMTLVLGRPRDARRWPKDPHSELGTISPRAVPDGVDGYIASPTGTTDLQHRAWFFPKRSGLGAPAAGSRVPWTKA